MKRPNWTVRSSVGTNTSRLPGYSLFTILGILSIVVFNTTIISTDLYLLQLVARSFHSVNDRTDPEDVPEEFLSAWDRDNILQIQRQTFELRGIDS